MDTNSNNGNEIAALPEEYRRGFTVFCGCRIDLSKRVLIPRPETEFMARSAIRDLALNGPYKPRVLDIFSGSGCIGIAVAKNIETAAVNFSDIDPAAVEQIKINLVINAISPERVKIFESDIFSGIPSGLKYDVILANPPYVDPELAAQVQRSVLDHEPRRALFGGRQGLEVIEKFLGRVQDFLAPAGVLYMEFDPRQKEKIGLILDGCRYKRYAFFKDQFGFMRFVKIIS